MKKGEKRPPRSKEWCNRISNSLKGNVPWNKGKKGSQTAWNKGLKGQIPWNKGLKGIQIAWNKGKKCPQISKSKIGHLVSKETRLKMSAVEKPKREKHWRWKGGKSEYGEGWTQNLRKSIRERDHYTCQNVGDYKIEATKPLMFIIKTEINKIMTQKTL